MTSPVPASTIATADAIRENADNAYARARTDQTLNLDAIRKLIAKAFLTAKANMTTLENGSGGDYQRKVDGNLLVAFGVNDLAGTDPVARAQLAQLLRTAQQQIDDLSSTMDFGQVSQRAAQMLQRATETGDEVMARAVGRAAYDNNWTDILDTYLATRPAQSNAVAALTNMRAEAFSSTSIRSMWAFVLPTPPELQGLSNYGITAIAEAA